LSGSFRSTVREGQAGHGRKHAKNRCNILDHYVSYLLFVFVFVFVFVFELRLSRVFHTNLTAIHTSIF
jgi:hypothetical protein